MRYVITGLLLASVLSVGVGTVFAQAEGNAVPYFEGIEWFIVRSIDGRIDGRYESTIDTFEPAQDVVREADYIAARVTVVDPDWQPTGEDEEGQDDPVYLRLQAVWVPFGRYRAPEGPPIPEASPDFFTDDGFDWNTTSSQSGDRALVYVFSLTVPDFVGTNQARERGLIDYDVHWELWFETTNDTGDENAWTVASDCQRYQRSSFAGFCPPALFAIEHPSAMPPNAPPQADAGGDQIVLTGTDVQLDGIRTFDSFNFGFQPTLPNVFVKDNLTFTWEWISGPARVEPVYPNLTVHPELATVLLDTPGVYVYRLLVDDNANSAPTTDTVTITVTPDQPPNAPPTAIVSGPTTVVQVGDTVTLSGLASFDPEGAALSYRWTQTDEIGNSLTAEDRDRLFQPFSGTNTPEITWQTTQAGTFFFRLIVDDGELQGNTPFTVFVDEVRGQYITASEIRAQLLAEVISADGGSQPTAAESPNEQPSLMPACGGGLFPLLVVPVWLGLQRGRRR